MIRSNEAIYLQQSYCFYDFGLSPGRMIGQSPGERLELSLGSIRESLNYFYRGEKGGDSFYAFGYNSIALIAPLPLGVATRQVFIELRG